MIVLRSEEWNVECVDELYIIDKMNFFDELKCQKKNYIMGCQYFHQSKNIDILDFFGVFCFGLVECCQLLTKLTLPLLLFEA